jgi:hypothetical protein
VRRGPRAYVLLFLGLSLLYHSNLRPIASGDSLPAALIPFSILLDGSITLDRFGSYLDEHVGYEASVIRKKAGHWYSGYPIAGPVLATPLYLPAVVFARHWPAGSLVAFARVYEKAVAVALAAGSALALLFLLRRIAPEAAWLVTLLFAVGTGNWSTSSQALWPHTFGVPAIIGCFCAIERFSSPGPQAKWQWWAGIFAGCALAIRPTNAALLPALAVALLLQKAPLAGFLRVFGCPLVAVAGVAAYNLTLFQSPFGRYPTDLNARALSAAAGIIAGPGRGLLIYMPVAIFAFRAFVPRVGDSRRKHQPLVAAASVFALFHIAFVALYPIWWGGYCWGPRLLTEILPSIMVLTVIGTPALTGGLKWAFAAAALYGCFIQAVGAYCYPKGHWDHLPVSVDSQPSRLWNWADNPIGRTLEGGIAWEPYAIVGAGLRGGVPLAAQELQRLGINAY